MSVKINQSDVAFEKALSRSPENGFQLNDVTTAVRRQPVAPQLMTALFGGESDTVKLTTNKFTFDELSTEIVLPNGKRFDEFGKDIPKDKARGLSYEVGSFGIRSNVAPADYAGKRIPATEDLMNEAYLVSEMSAKSAKSWTMFDELALVQLITTDTNITRGGPMPEYNFYTDIMGTARPAKKSMTLSNASTDHFQNFADELDELETDAEKTFNSITMPIVLCGKTFFAQRLQIEKQQGGGGSLLNNRELRGMDLASMGVPESNFGSGSGIFNYQYFDSHDGLRYIRYTATIAGTKVIADEDAYMVPVGAENFIKMVYAPAMTRQYVGTEAQTMYGWSKEDDRAGVTMWTEKNVLPVLVNPQLIRRLTV